MVIRQALAVRRASAISASVVVAVAVLVLAGHAADASRLRNGLIGGVAVRPGAAVILICLGLAVLLRSVAAARVLGGAAMVIGAAAMIDWIVPIDSAAPVIRMSVPAAAAACLGGAAVVFARHRGAGQTLGVATGFIGAVTAVAFFYGADHLPGNAATPVTLPTGILLALWSVAYLLRVSDIGPFAIFRAEDQWASLTRRTAAVTLVAPLAVGALSLALARSGFYDERFAAALIVTTTTFTLLVAGVWLIERIRRSEAVYRTIVESAHDGIGLVGPDMRLLIANERLASMLGFPAGELTGRSISELIAGKDLPQLLDRATRRERDGQPTHTELRLHRRDGTEVPVISAASHVPMADGSPGSTVIILTDISERVRAEEARRISELPFRQLYESNVIGVAFWDETGVVHEANDHVLNIFGISRDELPGWRWSEHNTLESELADRKAIEELRTSGRCAVFEKECIRRDGARVWVQVMAAELDENRNIAFISDITERVTALQTLERAHDVLADRVAKLEGIEAADLAHEREQVEVLARRLASATEELEQFSYSVSHDLRAPLRAIDGFSRELLLNNADRLDEDGRRYLTRICAATQRMARLIDDLLDLSRLSRRPMNRSKVDVSALAADVAGELGAPHVEIQPGLTASADPHLLRVVLQNLIGNAVKFSSRRESPKVEVLSNGNGTLIVRDNGVGFDMQYVSKIFAPFQRLHPQSQFEGTGIGLALVQRIVSRHGGTIRVESAPDRGASFFLTLGDPQT